MLMNLDDLMITCFCWIDEMMPAIMRGQRLRQRGPLPRLADSEVLTMKVVGAYLGLSQDKARFAYFHQHYQHFLPALAEVHRTTFVRQAANLWAIKERLWCALRDQVVRHDWQLSIINSMPLPVCRFARAPWCVRFRGIASYGKDHADRQTCYGFRLHVRVGWPGLITHLFLAPANEADGEIAPLILAGTQGIALGDRNYWLPELQAALRSQGLRLLAPFRKAHSAKAVAYHRPVLG
jgi:hypothetical protein